MAQQGKKKKGGAAKVILAVLLVVILTAGGCLLAAKKEINGSASAQSAVSVSIPQGSGVAAIANRLKDAGVIRSAYLFRWYVGQKGSSNTESSSLLPAAPTMPSSRPSLPTRRPTASG